MPWTGAPGCSPAGRRCPVGNFYEPTVLADVPADSRCSARRSSARWRRSPRSPTTRMPSPRPMHRVRPGRVRLHRRPDPDAPGRRGDGVRDGRCHRHRVQPRGTVRGVKQSGFGRRAASRASTSTSRPSTSASRCDLRRRRGLLDLPNPPHGGAPDGGLSLMSTSTSTWHATRVGAMDRRRSVAALLEARRGAEARGPARRAGSGPPASTCSTPPSVGVALRRARPPGGSERRRQDDDGPADGAQRGPVRGTRRLPSSTTRRPSSSGSSRSRPPRQPSRRDSTPPPRRRPRVRAVFEAEDPDRRGSRGRPGAHPLRHRRLPLRAGYALRLHIHESNQQTDPDEVAGVAAAVGGVRRAPARAHRLPRRCRSRTTSATRPSASRSSPRRSRTCPRVRVPRRVHLGRRPRGPRGGPPHAHPRPARLLGARLRGRPGHHPVEQGEHRLREHLVYDLGSVRRFRRWAVITVEKNRHGQAGRARRCRRTSSTGALPRGAGRQRAPHRGAHLHDVTRASHSRLHVRQAERRQWARSLPFRRRPGLDRSIGTQALDVIARNRDRFTVAAASAGGTSGLLARQAVEHESPRGRGPGRGRGRARGRGRGGGSRRAPGLRPRGRRRDDAATVAAGRGADVVLNGITGSIGLRPTSRRWGGVDLAWPTRSRSSSAGPSSGRLPGPTRSCWSTPSTAPSPRACAAGGRPRCGGSSSPRAGSVPGRSRAQPTDVTPEQALAHLNFSMGRVITTNSATLVSRDSRSPRRTCSSTCRSTGSTSSCTRSSRSTRWSSSTTGRRSLSSARRGCSCPSPSACPASERLEDVDEPCDWTRAQSWEPHPLDDDAFPRCGSRATSARPRHVPGRLQRRERGARRRLPRRRDPLHRHRRHRRARRGGAHWE